MEPLTCNNSPYHTIPVLKQFVILSSAKMDPYKVCRTNGTDVAVNLLVSKDFQPGEPFSDNVPSRLYIIIHVDSCVIMWEVGMCLECRV